MLPVVLTCRPLHLPGCAERPSRGEMPRAWVPGQGVCTLSLHISAKKVGVVANFSRLWGPFCHLAWEEAVPSLSLGSK